VIAIKKRVQIIVFHVFCNILLGIFTANTTNTELLVSMRILLDFHDSIEC